MTKAKPENIDAYIASFPKDTQKVLNLIRDSIKKFAPQAGEKISYGIPTFTLNDTYLIYFAGFAKHVSVYPAPVGVEEFKEDFSKYKTGKGTVQFPLDEPMPIDLLARIVKYRLEQNMLLAESEKQAKAKKKTLEK